MSNPTVIVSPFRSFIPVCKLLAQRGVKFWGPSPEWTQALIDVDLPARPLGSVVDGQVQDDAHIAAASIIRSVSPFSQNGLGNSAHRFMEDKGLAFLNPRLFEMCVMVKTLDRARPNLVLVHNDVEPQTRAMALWAKARGVPCLHIPHAVYQDINREPPISDIHDLITASHLGAASEVQRAWYELRGFQPENIRQTGLPQWDHWTQLQPIDRKIARRQLRIPEDAKVVTYASTWPQHTNPLGVNDQWMWAYDAFLRAIKQLPNVEGIVKLHPHGNTQSHQWHAQQAQVIGAGVTLTAEHLPTCLYASDLLVAFGGSNIIIEAAHLPHLRLMTTHGYENEPAIDKAPLDADGMLEAIQTSLSQPPKDTSAFRYRWAGECDGFNTHRVADYAMELIR